MQTAKNDTKDNKNDTKKVTYLRMAQMFGRLAGAVSGITSFPS
jgi:hypothetical protein